MKCDVTLFNKFILWFKKIFNIFLKPKYEKKEPPVKVTPKKKLIELIPLPEEKQQGIPSEEEPVESKPPEENTSEVPLKKIEIEPQIEHPAEEEKTKKTKAVQKKCTYRRKKRTWKAVRR